MSESKGPYRVFPTDRLVSGNLLLRSVQPDDIEAIRQWRNAQMDVLRQCTEISIQEQKSYYQTHVWPEMQKSDPRQILLALEREGTLIGYGGLVHVSWPNRRAEISFLLDSELASDHGASLKIFGDFLHGVRVLAFSVLGLGRLTTETYEHRTAFIDALEAAGFEREGRLRQHVDLGGHPSDSILHGLLKNDVDRAK